MAQIDDKSKSKFDVSLCKCCSNLIDITPWERYSMPDMCRHCSYSFVSWAQDQDWVKEPKSNEQFDEIVYNWVKKEIGKREAWKLWMQ